MRYGSVCSGIEAATAAWHPLGWEPAFFSEIEKFPRAVLESHYPDTPLHGDFTTIGEKEYGAIDLLVGGTPCQSFSVAGLRKGMDDDRGNLALEYLKLAQRKRPTWVVWENVPGILSSRQGRDFGSFLGAWSNSGMGSLTECLTLSIGEYPREDAGCSLSDILETGDHLSRYSLSEKALRGYLRRCTRLTPLTQDFLCLEIERVTGQSQKHLEPGTTKTHKK